MGQRGQWAAWRQGWPAALREEEVALFPRGAEPLCCEEPGPGRWGAPAGPEQRDGRVGLVLQWELPR